MTAGRLTDDATADQLHVAIAPSVAELPPLRAATAEWLNLDVEHLDVVDDVVLVVSEVAHLGIRLGVDDDPVVLHLRRTHSILVVEVTFRPLDPEAEISVVPGPSVDDVGIRIVDRLTDRVLSEHGPGTVTLRCTFELVP